MQSDVAKPWYPAELAAHAHLSASQFVNVFVDSFGVTPYTYLAILRVQRMAKLVRCLNAEVSFSRNTAVASQPCAAA